MGLSAFNFRVNGFEFTAGVVDFYLPIDSSLFVVHVVRPGIDFVLKRFKFADASSRTTLTRHVAQFVFGNVKPATMFGRENKINAANVLASSFRFESFVERAHRMRVEIVANQSDAIAVGVSSIKQ